MKEIIELQLTRRIAKMVKQCHLISCHLKPKLFPNLPRKLAWFVYNFKIQCQLSRKSCHGINTASIMSVIGNRVPVGGGAKRVMRSTHNKLTVSRAALIAGFACSQPEHGRMYNTTWHTQKHKHNKLQKAVDLYIFCLEAWLRHNWTNIKYGLWHARHTIWKPKFGLLLVLKKAIFSRSICWTDIEIMWGTI